MVMICGACARVRGAGDDTERGWHELERERKRKRERGGGSDDGGGGGGDYWSREICISRLNASVITVNSTTSRQVRVHTCTKRITTALCPSFSRSSTARFIHAGLFAYANLSRRVARVTANNKIPER